MILSRKLGIVCGVVLCMALVSCQRHSYDFSHSPNSPKAGELVSFANHSTAGESWVWTFGDGTQSTLKNPTHIYTAPGSYVVELMADSNKSRTIAHVLEVMDSVPSIALVSDTLPQYKPVTVKASLYNPKKAKVSYEWTLDESLFVLQEGSLTSDSVVGYYTAYDITTTVGLTITIGDKTTHTERTLVLIDQDAPSLLMEDAYGMVWRQRMYDGVYEDAQPYDDLSELTDANDSTAELNGVLYDIHDMPVLTDKTVIALQIDAVNRKLYVIQPDGVYVANANGDALVQIVSTEAYTLLVDAERNCLYWSDVEGVWRMPLVSTPQNTISNQLRDRIRKVNGVEDVVKLVVDN